MSLLFLLLLDHTIFHSLHAIGLPHQFNLLELHPWTSTMIHWIFLAQIPSFDSFLSFLEIFPKYTKMLLAHRERTVLDWTQRRTFIKNPCGWFFLSNTIKPKGECKASSLQGSNIQENTRKKPNKRSQVNSRGLHSPLTKVYHKRPQRPFSLAKHKTPWPTNRLTNLLIE